MQRTNDRKKTVVKKINLINNNQRSNPAKIKELSKK